MYANSKNTNTNIILVVLGFSIIPVIILLLASLTCIIDFPQASAAINTYGLLAGVFYFFRRLEFDKKSNSIKAKKERIEALRKDILELDNLFKSLLAVNFTTDNELAIHRNSIQSLNVQISSVLEISGSYGDIEELNIKKIIKLTSYIENSPFFINDLKNISQLPKPTAYIEYGAVLGVVRTLVYTMSFDLDIQHTKI